jgi:hypothetical protein
MRHKAFVGPASNWNFRSLDDNREPIREQAEAFIKDPRMSSRWWSMK